MQVRIYSLQLLQQEIVITAAGFFVLDFGALYGVSVFRSEIPQHDFVSVFRLVGDVSVHIGAAGPRCRRRINTRKTRDARV